MSSVGWRIDHPRSLPLRTESISKTMLEHTNAAASVPSASITPPSRVARSAINAPQRGADQRAEQRGAAGS